MHLRVQQLLVGAALRHQARRVHPVSFKTRVRFKDGDEVKGTHHNGTAAQALSDAVRHAEESRGEPHDGAWAEHEKDTPA